MRKLLFLSIVTAILFTIPENVLAIHYELPDRNEYDVKNIPTKLKKDANAVIRKDLTTFEFQDESKTVKKVVFDVKIFNKDKQHYDELQL